MTRQDVEHSYRPTHWELFAGFLDVASRSFGGAAAWTRFVLVERRRWLTDAEFTEAWGLAQLVPGPNVINLAVHVGDRSRGLFGALAAFTGIIVVPTLGALCLDVVAMRWMGVPVFQRALLGLGAAAAGLVWAMGIKMGVRYRRSPMSLLLVACTFVLAGPLRASLPFVVACVAPVGLFFAWRQR